MAARRCACCKAELIGRYGSTHRRSFGFLLCLRCADFSDRVASLAHELIRKNLTGLGLLPPHLAKPPARPISRRLVHRSGRT